MRKKLNKISSKVRNNKKIVKEKKHNKLQNKKQKNVETDNSLEKA